MRIADSAREHEVPDADIRHAVRHAIREIDLGDGLTMLIGGAVTGHLLEIGVLDFDSDDPVAIHAMRLRKKFHRFL